MVCVYAGVWCLDNAYYYYYNLPDCVRYVQMHAVPHQPCLTNLVAHTYPYLDVKNVADTLSYAYK